MTINNNTYGAIIALDVAYNAKTLGVDGVSNREGMLMECAADFARYCNEIGDLIEQRRVKAKGDFYPVFVAEHIADQFNQWRDKPLPIPADVVNEAVTVMENAFGGSN